MIVPFSIFPETQWPAVPSPYAAGLLGVLYQLEHTQWCSPNELAAHQARQLRVVAQHAYATVPFYRERFDALNLKPADVGSTENWLQLPLLTRRDIQLDFARLHSTSPPKNHGTLSTTTTGGSTGQPVTVQTTEFADFFCAR